MFLKGPRYSVLYDIDVTDYRSWAQGLRDCGYAEDANYPAKLITIIQQYELYALNGGKRLDGTIVVEVAEQDNESSSSDRWHHRKRRNRSEQRETQEVTQQQQPAFSPMSQGRVGSSADND
jgi:hypothetical protein